MPADDMHERLPAGCEMILRRVVTHLKQQHWTGAIIGLAICDSEKGAAFP